MMGYSFSIIAIIIAFASKIFTSENASHSIPIFPNPYTLKNPGESSMLGLVFLGLFLGGLLIHAFIVSQRAIIDREISRIIGIRNYFLSKPNISNKLKEELSFNVNPGSKDIIAKIRLSLPIIVNSFSFTLCLIYYKVESLWGSKYSLWGCNYCIIIFIVMGVILYCLINILFLKYIESSVSAKNKEFHGPRPKDS